MTKTRDELYMSPVEVITSVARRRRWRPEEKRSMVQEAETPGMSVSSVARKYGIHPNQLFRWRRLMYEGALCAVRAGEEVVSATEVKALRERIREEYSIDIEEAGPRAPAEGEEPFEEGAAREEVERLKARLRSMGPVNLLALDEYDEENNQAYNVLSII